uniref:hypothetical protein n=1 Tax=Rhodococcus qingshengii TaxID=334542 RepID=UPI001C4DF044|nr:hypothetical protein [Rhodococcus qingshengii]
MNGAEVALAALGILATIAGALIWTVKFMLTKNDQTLNKLAKSIDKSANASDALQKSLRERDARDHEFQQEVIKNFAKVSNSLDRVESKADASFSVVQSIAESLSSENLT